MWSLWYIWPLLLCRPVGWLNCSPVFWWLLFTLKHFFLSGIISYQPPKLNKQMIYEGGATTVWQLGSVLYNLLVRDKRFNTQMFLLDEAQFLSDLKDLNVTKGNHNNVAMLILCWWPSNEPLTLTSNLCVAFCLILFQTAWIFSKRVWISTPRSVQLSKNWQCTPGLTNLPLNCETNSSGHHFCRTDMKNVQMYICK